MHSMLVPNPFWRHPDRFVSLFDEDDNLPMWSPAASGLQVSEDETHVYVEAALPGVDPHDIEVTFDKGMLWIKGEGKVEEKDTKRTFYRKTSQSFSYRVAIPGDVDEAKEPEANCKNGVMTIAFTKVPEKQPKKIAVKTA